MQLRAVYQYLAGLKKQSYDYQFPIGYGFV